MEEQDIQYMIDSVTEQIERETGEKIFSVGSLKKESDENRLDMIFVLENKDILLTHITVEASGDEIKIIMQGNYLNR